VYAIFSLERARLARKVVRSAGMIFVLFLVVVGVYVLSHYVELPAAEAAVSKTPTPTLEAKTPMPGEPVRSRAATFEPTGVQPGDVAATEPTPTRRPRKTEVVIPTIVAQETPTLQVVPASCPHINVQILQPGQNQVIDAGTQVKGSADKESFDRYEFKFQSLDLADEWHWVQTFKAPVHDGDLGFWSTAHLPPGNYRFMLVAIDKMGNSQECIVSVIIRH
jgi:hypothetical protein